MPTIRQDTEPATLVEMIERRARERPRRTAFFFGGREHRFDDIWRGAGRFASLLAGRGIGAGERVVLALPNSPDFFAALFGAQRAGAVPVPLFPESGVERIADLAGRCGARLAVVGEATAAELDAALGGSRTGGEPAAVVTPAEVAAQPARHRPAPVGPDHPALIQYTSGSTGAPKGVVLTHRSLLTNVRQMIAGMEITAGDVFVSWLPVHHDMGLILMTLVPFYLGARLALLPSGLTDVRRWLDAVAVHRGTFTAAPDFAYRLCLRAVRDPSRFDLGSLRVALNAAEPVRAETIRRFEAAFGLDRVMAAGYGLAEATVGVSMQPPGTSPVVSERGFVAIGRPFPGVEIEIDPAGDRPPLRDGEASGEVGELVVASPAVCAGYFDDPQATAALFARPGAIRTGDLGYRSPAGEVFVVGRSKNVILQAGRNLAPQEIEEAVERLGFVRRAAAVGIDRGRAEGEQAWVFAELRRATPPPAAGLAEMARQVGESFHRRLGVRPGRVVLLAPRSIPRTANGKLRHAALREAWLGGELAAAGRVFYPETRPAG
jgi:acyl-CoA synthetase (AMP-forming)/AMP-acid ligase II